MVDDYKWWEVIVAWLKKEANFLSDPRTIATVVSVFVSLSALAKMLGWVDAELNSQQITLVLQSTAGVLAALAVFVTAISAVVVPLLMLVKSWTERPSRGIKPWLTPRG